MLKFMFAYLIIGVITYIRIALDLRKSETKDKLFLYTLLVPWSLILWPVEFASDVILALSPSK